MSISIHEVLRGVGLRRLLGREEAPSDIEDGLTLEAYRGNVEAFNFVLLVL